MLNHIGAFFGRDRPVSTITPFSCADFNSSLFKMMNDGGIARVSAHNRWSTFKSFLIWLDQMQLITIPKTINRDEYSFGIKKKHFRNAKKIPLEDVKALLNAADNRQKLVLLCGLNFGWTQKPIGDIDRTHIIDGHYVEYHRTKTEHHDNMPEISYLIWDETLEQLETEVLPTRSQAMHAWEDLIKKVGMKHKLKHLRSTAASMIWGGPHAKYVQYFLVHSTGDTIADNHYLDHPEQKGFDECVRWLRDQIFNE
jgi:hypothetical protein